MLSIALSVKAATEINGFYFDLNVVDKTAKIVYTEGQNYSGDIMIPSEIVYKDVKYTVESIGNYAFQQSKDLKSAEIPNSIQDLGEGLFFGCKNLIKVKLPDGISKVPYAIFHACKSLESVNIPNTVTTIAALAFCDCSSLTTIEIPNSVINIYSNAFEGCSGLTSFSFPNGVKRISSRVLSDCSRLKKVVLGNEVEKIEDNVFDGCSRLEDIFCYMEKLPETVKNTFYNCNAVDITLHVPDELVEKYLSTSPWNQFGSIVGLENGNDYNKKCAPPTITYAAGKIIFNSNTEGVDFVSSIKDSDINTFSGKEISLNATYEISVYATKTGCKNSDVTRATLCWIDVEPKMEGITNGVASVRANAVMIKTEEGQIIIEGAEDNTSINVYNLDGAQVGSTTSRNGVAFVNTNLSHNSIAVVKIGNKSVKVAIK